ncbi:hypothetical protein LP419_06425 [Massilia sp. H-1]|nr:hypothetical protein LP419_06425 [Massilia sp. H-1]
MVLFFTLSGFLITTALLLLSRACAPSWCAVFARGAAGLAVLPDRAGRVGRIGTGMAGPFLLYGNLPPRLLVPLTLHMWSLCMEVQFYVAAALLVAAAARGLWLLPLLGLLFTGLRIWHGVFASDISYYRIDEILA